MLNVYLQEYSVKKKHIWISILNFQHKKGTACAKFIHTCNTLIQIFEVEITCTLANTSTQLVYFQTMVVFILIKLTYTFAK